MRSFAAAFVLGTLLLQRSAELPSWNAVLAGLAALLAALLAGQHVVARAVLVAVAGLCLGFGYSAWRAQVRLDDALAHDWQGRDVALQGVVASLPRAGDKGARFLFEVTRVDTPEARVPARISLAWHTDGRGTRPIPAIAPGE